MKNKSSSSASRPLSNNKKRILSLENAEIIEELLSVAMRVNLKIFHEEYVLCSRDVAVYLTALLIYNPEYVREDGDNYFARLFNIGNLLAMLGLLCLMKIKRDWANECLVAISDIINKPFDTLEAYDRKLLQKRIDDLNWLLYETKDFSMIIRFYSLAILPINMLNTYVSKSRIASVEDEESNLLTNPLIAIVFVFIFRMIFHVLLPRLHHNYCDGDLIAPSLDKLYSEFQSKLTNVLSGFASIKTDVKLPQDASQLKLGRIEIIIHKITNRAINPKVLAKEICFVLSSHGVQAYPKNHRHSVINIMAATIFENFSLIAKMKDVDFVNLTEVLAQRLNVLGAVASARGLSGLCEKLKTTFKCEWHASYCNNDNGNLDVCFTPIIEKKHLKQKCHGIEVFCEQNDVDYFYDKKNDEPELYLLSRDIKHINNILNIQCRNYENDKK